MRLERTDLLGLAIGFALGAAGLAALSMGGDGPAAPHPQPPATTTVVPPAKTTVVPPAPRPPGTVPQVWTPPKPGKGPQKVAMPAPIALPPVTTLPNVIRPTHPGGKGDTAGTGFFVTDDGMLLTAAHVVEGCANLRLISPFIPPTRAETLAIDRDRDIAILRAHRLRPPASLALGPPRAGRERARLLGYPGDGDPRVASEAEGEVRNDTAPGLIGRSVDPAEQVWLRGERVRPGFSGGPVIGRDGQVMGLVFGQIRFDHRDGSSTGVVVGPGSRALAGFVRQATGDVLAVAGRGAENDDGAVRRAVVHVICNR